MSDPDLANVVARLCRQFPAVPLHAISSIVDEAYEVVIEAAGRAQVDKTEELARLLLEVRSGRPALADGPEPG